MTLVKQLFLFILFLSLFLGVADRAYAADPSRKVRVGIYDNKPKVYALDDGTAVGLFPDILDFIAKKENWDLEYVFGTWEQGLIRLEEGEIDLMVDVAISDERMAKYDFTRETVFNSWGVIYVQRASPIESFMDLEGKKIAILKSSIYLGEPGGVDSYMKAFGVNMVLVEVDNYNEVFDFLEMGVVDAAVVSRIFGLINQPDYQNIRPTNLFFKPTELRFALTKGDGDNAYLIEKLDHWVKQLKDGYEGYYEATLKKHGLLQPAPAKPALAAKEVSTAVRGFPAGLAALAVVVLFLGLVCVLLVRKKTLNQLSVVAFAFNPEAEVVMLKELGVKRKLSGKSLEDLVDGNEVILENAKKAMMGRELEFKAQVWNDDWQIHFTPIKTDKHVKLIVATAVEADG